MIKRISSLIVNNLVVKGLIVADDKDLYEYAATVLCCLIAPFILISLLIPITGLIYEGFIMIIPFTFLRRYCGGFHFKSSTICSIVSFFYLLAMEEVGKRLNITKGLIIITLICLAILLVISLYKTSIYNQNSQKRRNISVITISSILLVSVILTYINACDCNKWICIGIVMTLNLQLPVFLKYLVNCCTTIRMKNRKCRFSQEESRFAYKTLKE